MILLLDIHSFADTSNIFLLKLEMSVAKLAGYIRRQESTKSIILAKKISLNTGKSHKVMFYLLQES